MFNTFHFNLSECILYSIHGIQPIRDKIRNVKYSCQVYNEKGKFIENNIDKEYYKIIILNQNTILN